MIYAFFGTDVITTRSNAQDFYTNKESSITRFTADNWHVEDIEQALGSVSLFGEADIYVLDTPAENAEMQAYIFKNIKVFAESPNTFVLIEGALRAPEKKKLEKYAENIVEATLQKEKEFNIFGLADALSRRDKKSLWILYTQAQNAGHASEEILGTLFWQVKVLVLATKTNSAEEAGVSTYPYNKAKQALRNFTAVELENMLTSLIVIYHNGHRGVEDMDTALEKWILTL